MNRLFVVALWCQQLARVERVMMEQIKVSIWESLFLLGEKGLQLLEDVWSFLVRKVDVQSGDGPEDVVGFEELHI